MLASLSCCYRSCTHLLWWLSSTTWDCYFWNHVFDEWSYGIYFWQGWRFLLIDDARPNCPVVGWRWRSLSATGTVHNAWWPVVYLVLKVWVLPIWIIWVLSAKNKRLSGSLVAFVRCEVILALYEMQSYLGCDVVCLFYFWDVGSSRSFGVSGVVEIFFYFDKRFELISCRRWINWRVVEKLCCIWPLLKGDLPEERSVVWKFWSSRGEDGVENIE